MPIQGTLKSYIGCRVYFLPADIVESNSVAAAAATHSFAYLCVREQYCCSSSGGSGGGSTDAFVCVSVHQRTVLLYKQQWLRRRQQWRRQLRMRLRSFASEANFAFVRYCCSSAYTTHFVRIRCIAMRLFIPSSTKWQKVMHRPLH